MGGRKTSGYNQAIHRYNPDDDTWTAVAGASFPNNMFGMQVMPFNY